MSSPGDAGAASKSPVAFQGELGAFSEEAVRQYFGHGAEPVPCRDFIDVSRSVLTGDVEYGVLPIENSLAGSVIPSYDALAAGELEIIGEVITPIHHCILGIPGASLEDVRRILSHPVALMQCTRVLRELADVEAVAVYDTAGAAKDVADAGDPTQAAIAGAGAAERYGLEILAADVEDRHDNQTRFLIVQPAQRQADDRARSWPARTPSTRPKSALLIETANAPGALLRVLAPFASRGINLTKLESRPAGEPWSYRFFIEIEADAGAREAALALEEAASSAQSVKVLGTYARWDGPR